MCNITVSNRKPSEENAGHVSTEIQSNSRLGDVEANDVQEETNQHVRISRPCGGACLTLLYLLKHYLTKNTVVLAVN